MATLYLDNTSPVVFNVLSPNCAPFQSISTALNDFVKSFGFSEKYSASNLLPSIFEAWVYFPPAVNITSDDTLNIVLS